MTVSISETVKPIESAPAVTECVWGLTTRSYVTPERSRVSAVPPRSLTDSHQIDVVLTDQHDRSSALRVSDQAERRALAEIAAAIPLVQRRTGPGRECPGRCQMTRGGCGQNRARTGRSQDQSFSITLPLDQLLLQIQDRFARCRDVLGHIRLVDAPPFEMLQLQTVLVEFSLPLRECHIQQGFF